MPRRDSCIAAALSKRTGFTAPPAGYRILLLQPNTTLMTKSFRNFFLTPWLCVLLIPVIQSCDDNGAQLAKQKVHFTFSASDPSDDGRGKDIELPEGSRLKLSIEASNGTSVFDDHELTLMKAGDSYIADPVELMPGGYVLTDFMIVNEGEMLYATPRAGSPLSAFVTNPVPHEFTVSENTVTNVSMQVIDVREYAPEEFGYVSFTANVVNLLSVSAFTTRDGQTSLTEATGELRRRETLVKSFSLAASVNTIAFEGDPDAEYTLTIYTAAEGQVTTFNFKEMKEALGNQPLKVNLVPALILSQESHFREEDGWEDPFALTLGGDAGALTLHWGDGSTDAGTLPFQGSHQYTEGNYTAIITGDIDRITDFWGFAYDTYMTAIKGLTNLTALKIYNPSWGAVPLKVDLSNCQNLETIFIERLGGPYVPIDLRTDFKLPPQHFIDDYVFYAPGLLETREEITAEELAIMVDNMFNNVTTRNITGGRFIVTPVSDPSPETQQKLDIMQNDYGWRIGLNSEDIYDDSSSGRTSLTLDARRENWLRARAARTKGITSR